MIRTPAMEGEAIRKEAGTPENFQRGHWNSSFHLLALAVTLLVLTGCGMFNMGKFRWIERTASDEKYYLVKDIFLTAGSTYNRKETFDHNMNETVNLMFIPKLEKNTYTTESIWYDPNGEEFITRRETYDQQSENKKGEDRQATGTTRVHTVPTKALFEKKPGLWKVALYIEGDLVRRLTFSLR
jgi:hypothetical protein